MAKNPPPTPRPPGEIAKDLRKIWEELVRSPRTMHNNSARVKVFEAAVALKAEAKVKHPQLVFNDSHPNSGKTWTMTPFYCDGCGIKRHRRDPNNNPFSLVGNRRLCYSCRDTGQ